LQVIDDGIILAAVTVFILFTMMFPEKDPMLDPASIFYKLNAVLFSIFLTTFIGVATCAGLGLCYWIWTGGMNDPRQPAQVNRTVYINCPRGPDCPCSHSKVDDRSKKHP